MKICFLILQYIFSIFFFFLKLSFFEGFLSCILVEIVFCPCCYPIFFFSSLITACVLCVKEITIFEGILLTNKKFKKKIRKERKTKRKVIAVNGGRVNFFNF